ncbi:MAG: EAL domain-containing protein [Spirochaetales bacterium]|nr:EAL domain-containing protein [Spirochaetales bacterium]
MGPKPREISSYKFHKILKRKWFFSQFHPILSLKEKRILGLEALSRGYWMQKANRVNPYFLIEAAKKYHRETQLDDLWLQLSMENFSKSAFCRENLLLFLNINTSRVKEFQHYSQWVIKLIENYHLSPDQIVIEIVESESLDINALKEFTMILKHSGVHLALDDLGAGYSNFDRILQLEPELVKVDRSLIQDIFNNHTKQSTFRSIIDLAHRMGILVVAEGVENLAEIIQCGILGADLFQGYFFAHPLEIEKINESLCSDRIKQANVEYKNHLNDTLSHKIDYHKNLKKTVELIEFDVLDKKDFFNLEDSFRKISLRFPHIDSFFILDHQGKQVSPGYGTPKQKNRFGLYNPSELGTDHSMKTYFISSLRGMDFFISDPYISLSNGKLCKTIVRPFRIDQKWYHLCVDFLVDLEKDQSLVLGL